MRRGDEDWPDMEGKVFYVWFDAPIAYIGATVEWAEATGSDWQRWWREDQGAEDVRYVQFMAKDNIPFHALSFPATIMGSGEPWKQVDYIKGFNWLTFDGGKFSTSQNRGVFMDQALELLPADCWRWWLLSHAPESGNSDFTWESLRDGVNKDLADVLGNFVNRTTSFTANRYDGRLPEGGENGQLEAELVAETETRLRAHESAMEAIEFRRATAELRALWATRNEYLTGPNPGRRSRPIPAARPQPCAWPSISSACRPSPAPPSCPKPPPASSPHCAFRPRPSGTGRKMWPARSKPFPPAMPSSPQHRYSPRSPMMM